MKSLKLVLAAMVLFLAISVKAQVSLSVNIGSPPMWGPVGYSGIRYYYLPDVEAYYDINSSMFIYYEGSRWVHRGYLPDRYRNYDLYGGYKVVMKDYRGDAPYSNFKEYRSKYGRGYHNGPQRTIGERHGNRNSGEKMHNNGPQNKNQNKGNNKNMNHGNDKGNSHGNDKNMKGDKGHGNDKGKK